jgi:hypothetical protein
MVLRWKRAKTERSPRAAFVGFIGNPFEIEVLVDVVPRAVQEPSAAVQVRHADQPIASGQRLNTTHCVDELGLPEPF